MWEKIYEGMTKDEPETGKLEGMASVSNLKSFFLFGVGVTGHSGTLAERSVKLKKKKTITKTRTQNACRTQRHKKKTRKQCIE